MMGLSNGTPWNIGSIGSVWTACGTGCLKVPINFQENTPICCAVPGGQWMSQHSCRGCLPIYECWNHGQNSQGGAPPTYRLVYNAIDWFLCTKHIIIHLQ